MNKSTTESSSDINTSVSVSELHLMTQSTLRGWFLNFGGSVYLAVMKALNKTIIFL